MNKRLFSLFLLLACLFTAQPVQAQTVTPPPTGPIYIIQSGDSLSSIASRFGISLTDLMAANNFSDANNIAVGDKVLIPGLEGISGILVTELIGYGDTLQSLARRNQVSEGFLRKLNHITSPSELYVGVGLVLPQKDNFTPLTRRVTLAPGESLLEAAVRENSDPWTLAQTNELAGTWRPLAGEVLYTTGENTSTTPPNGLPAAFANVTFGPLPLIQGGTAVIKLQTQPGVTLGGILVDQPLHFFPLEDGTFVALQGVHAMLDPGPYPLKLEATLPDGSKQSFEQMILIQSGNYPNDPLLVVDPATIDPTVTEPELAQIRALTSQATPQKYWEGLFQNPSVYTDCFTSRYGNRRVYEGKGTDLTITSFHSGLDFCGGEGLQITAPANGVIVFAGPLSVRGNATIIDHGWGIYSGFWHQSEIKVQVGQTVSTGEVIGLVGGTGRVTGAHQHWEVWVNGIQVNPMSWLEKVYP